MGVCVLIFRVMCDKNFRFCCEKQSSCKIGSVNASQFSQSSVFQFVVIELTSQNVFFFSNRNLYWVRMYSRGGGVQ
jgi:hypothetical protein